MLDIQKRLTKPFFVLLSLPATAMGFALSVQIAALSWILSTRYGLDIHDVGLVWAAGPIAGILGQVIVGAISDNVWFWGGRRRPFILIGGVLAALMLLALPHIDVIAAGLGVDGILGVAIVVALTLDLSINVSFNPTRSLIADVTPEGVKRTQGYTWMQTISGTFGVLAYAIGAIWDNYTLIYVGAVLVLLFSVLPPLFIREPRSLDGDEEDDVVGPMDPQARPEADVLQADLEVPASAPGGVPLRDVLRAIEPLWGFFIYAVYAMTLRLAGIDLGHYYVEFALLGLTVLLMARSLLQPEAGRPRREVGLIGFRKVLAAHAFTWVGVQTMFVYLFAYVQDKMPALDDDEVGAVINISFLLFNAVAAVLPAFVLEPLTERIGRVKTHLACIAIMAAAYAGLLLTGLTPLAVYAWMVVAGIGWAATVSLPFAIMSQKVDKARMGLYMGLFNLSVVLPQLVASLGIGEVVSRAEDKRIIFIICAVSLALSAVAWTFVKDEEGAPVAPVAASGH
ncbi:MAG: MFS transporter [Bacteroidetes bacterium]|nr:MAG: MFS transporter [Bacteroidota bacterium]